jgi:hypothetical protein
MRISRPTRCLATARGAGLQGRGDAGVVRQVTGRERTDFETYAATAAARGAWRD